jgi:hypothetical protein
MILESAKDPVWADTQHKRIKLFCKFKEFDEFFDFMASEEDCEKHGRDICKRAKAGEFGEVREFQPVSQDVIKKDLENQVKNIRDDLLSQTDWTQLSDVELSDQAKDEWKLFRKQVREIKKQPKYPYDVTYPTVPFEDAKIKSILESRKKLI